jgi:hypothetical protein
MSGLPESGHGWPIYRPIGAGGTVEEMSAAKLAARCQAFQSIRPEIRLSHPFPGIFGYCPRQNPASQEAPMRQRGRKSAANLTVVPVIESERPAPPAGLTAAEKRLWRHTVAMFPPHTFLPCLPVLQIYVEAVCMQEELGAQLRALDPADGRYPVLAKLLRDGRMAVAKFAGILKLTPRSNWSRTSPQLSMTTRPWQILDEQPDEPPRRDFSRELAEVIGKADSKRAADISDVSPEEPPAA